MPEEDRGDSSDPAATARRPALHDRYVDVARVGDASRLAYLHGPESVWTEEQVAALWHRAASNPISSMPPLNSVYIHVPFCKSICNFCNYDRLQPSSPTLLKTWLARVLRSIEVIGPAVRPLTFHALYIGGGTPSVLPAHMLHELLEALHKTLSWHPRAQRKLEFDPAVMNRDRLKVLAAHGLRQLSFGIETLDPEVNARHNRGRQGIESIERCFEDLKAEGFSDVACDFLLGLEGTTPEGMLREMETVITRFAPEWVDIFMITPTPSYVDRHFAGSWDAFWSHRKRFESAVPEALPALARHTGYKLLTGQSHHMRLKRRFWRSLATRGIPWPPTLPGRFGSYTPLTSVARRPVNVLGLGRSARSVIFGTAAFAAHDPDDNPASEGPAGYVGNFLNLTDEARGFLVYVLRDGDAVRRSEFRRIFGKDMTEVIPTALAGWASNGTARLDARQLRLAEQDRLQRIRTLLWLVPEEAIEFDLAHFGQLELSPSGVGALAAGLERGTDLGGGHAFEGTNGTRLLVRAPDGEMLRLRVAPGLSDGEPLRLLLDSPPRSGDEHALRSALARLRDALTRQHRTLTSHPPSPRSAQPLSR